MPPDPPPPPGQGGNALLAALPPEERECLRPVLERVPLPLRLVLEEPHRPVESLWFPRSGVASMVQEMADGASVEVATIGREGMVGLPVVLGSGQLGSGELGSGQLGSGQSTQRVFVQVPGEADRLPAAAYRRLRPRLPVLERLLLRYALSLVTQVSQGSACNRLHPVEARCARWLLLTHDRVAGDRFPMTQEFLSQMLGVTRPSVTLAAGALQKAGLIRTARGVVEVLDRPGLEAASCECYGVVVREFRRLVRPDS